MQSLIKSKVKKDVKSKVRPKNGCDGRLMTKKFISTIQVILVPNPSGGGNTNSSELFLLTFLPLIMEVASFFYSLVIFLVR